MILPKSLGTVEGISIVSSSSYRVNSFVPAPPYVVDGISSSDDDDDESSLDSLELFLSCRGTIGISFALNNNKPHSHTIQ